MTKVKEPGFYWIRFSDRLIQEEEYYKDCLIGECYFSKLSGGGMNVSWTIIGSELVWEDKDIVVMSSRIEHPLKAFL